MELIAHTPPKPSAGEKPLPLHTYRAHIQEMLDYGLPLFDYILSFSQFQSETQERLKETFKATLMLHDLGKADEENQRILRQEATGRLPVDHIDAGVAVANNMQNRLLAWLIRGHHAPGLVNYLDERQFQKKLPRNVEHINTDKSNDYWLRGKRHKRTNIERADYVEHYKAIEKTNERLDDYLKRQITSCGHFPNIACKLPEAGLTTRLILSCLVDADHTSASHYHQNIPMKTFLPANTRWQARLQQLNHYVSQLDKTPYAQKSPRNQLREDFYQHCLTRDLPEHRLEMCSASVGLGKTTSVTADLLRKAIASNASRLFIIAPFTNILTQTVNTLRKALVLEGESAEATVIEHHHKVEFSDAAMRQYACSWDAPIIVTTAVQFFETLASAYPSRLKKLHHLVGSVIFIDESHACLPPELLAVSWKWLKQLADNWGCHIVFSSGSMVEFWHNEYLVPEARDRQVLPELLSETLVEKMKKLETQRVDYQQLGMLDKHQLVARVVDDLSIFEQQNSEKPCSLIILNTTQSSAFIAYYLAEALGEDPNKPKPLEQRQVLQLSTTITPVDRKRVIAEIERRQKASEWTMRPWYLVATSCVEAGVDLDFQLAYRERCSVASFLQTSGRVNRHGERDAAILYDFSIEKDKEINHHPNFTRSRDIFNNEYPKLVMPQADINRIVTRALQNTFLNNGKATPEKDVQSALVHAENTNNFQTVDESYRIINSETYTVITDKEIVGCLREGRFVDWRQIQNHSVQLWLKKIAHFHLTPIPNAQIDQVYSWIDTYDYNDFLGIFAGVIEVDNFFTIEGGVF